MTSLVRWCTCLFSFCFRMVNSPCELCPDDALLVDHLTDWLHENCPDQSLSPPGTMAAQLAKGLEVEEKMLHLGVESILTDLDSGMILVHDLWLSERGISLDQVQLVGSDTDGLFIWCASK